MAADENPGTTGKRARRRGATAPAAPAIKISFNIDAALEADLNTEHAYRATKFQDASWTTSSTIRALLREAIAQARANRGGTQTSLPLTESSTTKT